MERYTRQIPVLTPQGQERLRRASVLIAGLGGLGSAAATYLAMAGVGRLVLVDGDRVELSNLNRQILYETGDIGRLKAEAAAEKISRLNPEVEAVPVPERIGPSNVDRLVESVDVVVDALDNWDSRFLLNRAAVAHGKPLVHGAVEGMQGQLLVVIPGRTACLECVFGGAKGRGGAVLGPVAGAIGVMEALEAIKLIAGLGEPLAGRLLIADFSSGTFDVLNVKRRPGCPVCGAAGI